MLNLNIFIGKYINLNHKLTPIKRLFVRKTNSGPKKGKNFTKQGYETHFASRVHFSYFIYTHFAFLRGFK